MERQKYIVRLSNEERSELEGIIKKGKGYNEPRHFDRALIYINVSPLKS